jgi:hypothetical protein
MPESQLEVLHGLLVGYPLPEARPREQLQDLQMNPRGEGLVPLAAEVPSLSDYHIVLIRDIAGMASIPESLDRLLEHRGVIAMGLRPFTPPFRYESRYNDPLAIAKSSYNQLWNTFLGEKMAGLLDDYLVCMPELGRNLVVEHSSSQSAAFSHPEVSFSIFARLETTSKLDALEKRREAANAVTGKGEHRSQYLEVFARNPGGSVVGAVLRTGTTTLVLHPIPVFVGGQSEAAKATATLTSFARELLDSATRLLVPKGPIALPPSWARTAFPDSAKEIQDAQRELDRATESAALLVDLCWESGTALEEVVERALRIIGVEVENVASAGGQRDLLAKIDGRDTVIEVKGKTGIVDLEDVSKFLVGNPKKHLMMVVNPYRQVSPSDRMTKAPTYAPLSQAALDAIRDAIRNKTVASFRTLTTIDLVSCLRRGGKMDEFLAWASFVQPR